MPVHPPGSDGARRPPLRASLLTALASAVLAAALCRVAARPASAAGPAKTGHAPATLPATQPQAPKPRLSPDPRADGWDTEAFNEESDAQLKALGKLLTHPEHLDAAHLAPLLADDFTCGDLRPTSLQPAYQDARTEVRRQAAGAPAAAAGGQAHRGAEGLLAALRPLLSPFAKARDLRFKFKMIAVERHGPGDVTTRQYLALIGRRDDGMVEQNSTWTARWRQDRPGTPPRLREIRVSDFEEVTTRGAGGPLFSDLTAAVLGPNASFREQLARGNPYWRSRIESYHQIHLFGHNGLALGDVNGDGYDDLYVCQPGGLPNRLFVQKPGGTSADVSAEAGVDFLDNTQSALLIDLDNDGDQDLVAAMAGGLLLLENDGRGRFTVRGTSAPVANIYSLAAADYDTDGDLDVYACVYYGSGDDDASEIPVPMPQYDANNGGRNRLFRNDGKWRMTDVTATVGLDHNNRRFSYAAAWDDYDNDGDLDLYVANDFGRNNLYRNEGPQARAHQFSDVADAAGLSSGAFGMAAAFGDYDRDGLMDIHLGAMFSSAGSRITTQRQFMPDKPQEVRERFRHMARGNSLFHNDGGGTFRDVSVDANITYGRWAWASLFFDLNNDGWEDILVANGFVTGALLDDL